MSKVRIAVLVDNLVVHSEMLGAHGLSLWIETNNTRILFDAGRRTVLHYNIDALKIPLAKTDVIVLSHGHYDHTDGLFCALNYTTNAKIFMHPSALQPHFSYKAGISHFIGVPPDVIQLLEKLKANIFSTKAITQIADGVFCTGFIPKNNLWEDTGGAFSTDDSALQTDHLPDDQAMWIETRKGLIMVSGCAHSGIINTLEYILDNSKSRPLLAVIGGFHLNSTKPDRITKTINKFKEFKIKNIVPLHCTGIKAISACLDLNTCVIAGAGSILEF